MKKPLQGNSKVGNWHSNDRRSDFCPDIAPSCLFLAPQPIQYMRLYLLFPVLVYCCACGAGRRDIRDFYFPVGSLRHAQVYVYEANENGHISTEYWYYQSFLRDSGLFLTATYYDPAFQIRQITRERITESGALAREYFLFEPDSSGDKLVQIKANIESGSVFPFSVLDSTGIFLFKLQYRPPSQAGANIHLIRNRYYTGNAPVFTWKGKNYPCIRLGVREAVGIETEGTAEIEGAGQEWYAKNLGLVYSERTFGKGNLRRSIRLVDTISMDELIRRSGSSLPVQ